MVATRLIVDAAGPGDWNMAVDQWLLESAERHAQPALRFYQWRTPTVSLGYFQRLEEREGHDASRACPLVRRATGGGAIVHDRELTYSLALPMPAAGRGDTAHLYRLMHETLIDELSRWGVSSRWNEGLGGGEQTPPFLCFQRRGTGDVLVEQAKIVGSAQRRRRRALLQHGSLLLAASPAAPELPGLAELTGIDLPIPRLIEGWVARLAHRAGWQMRRQALSPVERASAAQLVQQRYADPAWTARR